MEKLILFRKSIESLNTAEFKWCILSMGRQLLTTLIFRGLLHHLDNDSSRCEFDIDVFLLIVKYFVERRRNANNSTVPSIESVSKNTEPEAVNLDDLPNVLLSEISSFLEFEDHLNFQTTNRTIFIGSRSSPLPFHSLNSSMCRKLVTFRHHHSTSLLPQPIFKSVAINCTDLVERRRDYHEDGEWSAIDDLSFEPTGLDFIRRAQTLTIDLGDDDEFEDDKLTEALESVLKNIILNQSPAFPNLNELHVYCGDENLDEQMVYFRRLIRRSNIEHLEFHGMCFVNTGFRNYKWVRKLRGVAFSADRICSTLDASSITRRVHSKLTDKLESLHVEERIIDDDFKGKLVNLKELCIRVGFDGSLDYDEAYRLLLNEQMPKLKRFHFHRPFWREIRTNEPFALWLQKVLKTVEYFCYDVRLKDIPRTFKLIRFALLAVTPRTRQLKIRINRYTGSLHEFDLTLLIETMRELIDTLHEKCDNWSLILHGIQAKGKSNNTVNTQLRAEICRLNQINGYNAFVNMREDVQRDIVVRGVEMSGIREPWIMHCSSCSIFG